MTERTFRIVLGAVLLAALYYELPMVVYGYIVVLLFEATTNWRIPILVTRLAGGATSENATCPLSPGVKARVNFEAERAL
ncbi:MAG: hypothetical protein OEY27_06200, partial [Gammaproteobacteria bacterium]|nr:hypothetical protein [Gammaproteobacteria bacterium]